MATFDQYTNRRTNIVAGDGGRIADINLVHDMVNQIVAQLQTNGRLTDPILAEYIRDTISAALAAGPNILITKDDPGNVITIESTASGGGTGLPTDPADASDYQRNVGAAGTWFYELLSAGVRQWARSRVDGRPTLKGVAMRQTLDWYYGDPDPTANGALPSWVHVRAHLGASNPVPAWVLAINGAEVIRETSATTFEFMWDGVGLADESALAAGTAGTGDHPITALFNANAPTIETSELETPAVEYIASASQIGFYKTVTAGSQRRVGRWFKTPAAFSSVTILRLRSGATTEGLSVGLNTNGVIRVFNSGNVQSVASPNGTLAVNTWYWVEVGLTQNATATLGTFQMKVWDEAGGVVYTSGAPQTDQAGTPVGFGTSNDRLYFGVLTSATMTVYDSHFRATNDATVEIGPV